MVNEYGLVVECAYNNLEQKLNKYVSTPDQAKKNEQMLAIFNEFLQDLKRK